MRSKYADGCAVALRLAFFGCVTLLVLLSWLPSSEMVRTGAGGRLEHATAYFLTAIGIGLTCRGGPRLVVQCLLLVALAAILEAGQLFALGRTAAFSDFAAAVPASLLAAFGSGRCGSASRASPDDPYSSHSPNSRAENLPVRLDLESEAGTSTRERCSVAGVRCIARKDRELRQ